MRLLKLYPATIVLIAAAFLPPLPGQTPNPRLQFYGPPATDSKLPATAQPPGQLAAAIVAWRNQKNASVALSTLLDIGQNAHAFFYYMVGDQLAQDRFQRFVQLLENARMDKQAGTSAGNGSGTSLVSKPSATAVLSAAVETGALTQSLGSGPETTFRGNAVGVGRLLLGQEPFPFCPIDQENCDTGVVKALDSLSFSITTDTNGQKAVNVPISGSATGTSNTTATATTSTPSSVSLNSNAARVSAWAVRYSIYNHRNPNDKQYRERYQQSLASHAAALQAAAEATVKKFAPLFNGLNASQDKADKTASCNGEYNCWFSAALDHLSKLPPQTSDIDFENAFAGELDKAVAIMKKFDPKAVDDALQGLEALDAYLATRQEVLTDAKGDGIATFEYTNGKPVDEPATSNFKLILAAQPSKSIMLTLNVSATIYNTLPAGVTVSRWRDAQIAGQADIALGQIGSLTAPTFSAAGYFQYMRDPALITIGPGDLAPGTNIQLPNTSSVLLAAKGNTAIAQIELTFPVKNSGISVPFALTWANRTDLIKANDVSGHFGLTFDLDSLLSHAKGSTP